MVVDGPIAWFGSCPLQISAVEEAAAIFSLEAAAGDKTGVEKIEAGPKGALVSFHQDSISNLEGLVRFVQDQAGLVKLRPDSKLVYQDRWDDPRVRLAGVRELLDELGKIAA